MRPMLKLVPNIRQDPKEPFRRWYADDAGDLDLIVWFGKDRRISGFQLCYDLEKDQRAVTWRAETGFSHERVDDGENRPGRYKSTPILIPDGFLDKTDLIRRFEEKSGGLEKDVADFILKRLKTYPHPPSRAD